MAEAAVVLPIVAKILGPYLLPIYKHIKHTKLYPNDDKIIKRIQSISDELAKIPDEEKRDEIMQRLNKIKAWLIVVYEQQEAWRVNYPSYLDKFDRNRRRDLSQAKELSKLMKKLAISTSAHACALNGTKPKNRSSSGTVPTVISLPVTNGLPQVDNVLAIAECCQTNLQETIAFVADVARGMKERGLGTVPKASLVYQAGTNPPPAAVANSATSPHPTASETSPEADDDDDDDDDLECSSTTASDTSLNLTDGDQEDLIDSTTESDASSILEFINDETSSVAGDCTNFAAALLSLPEIDLTSERLSAAMHYMMIDPGTD